MIVWILVLYDFSNADDVPLVLVALAWKIDYVEQALTVVEFEEFRFIGRIVRRTFGVIYDQVVISFSVENCRKLFVRHKDFIPKRSVLTESKVCPTIIICFLFCDNVARSF